MSKFIVLFNFLNFPREDGALCPARGALWLVVILVDRWQERITASHNSWRGWRGNLKTHRLFLPLHPACKYYPVLLFIYSVILGWMPCCSVQCVWMCADRSSPLTVVLKPDFNWLVGRVLEWNSGWSEDAVCRSEAAATAAVLCCSCCNFSSVWGQERFKECLLHLQRNHWKLQQGKSTSQAFLSFVLPTKYEFSWCT